MSTSGEQEKRPLTRRELRELRARGIDPRETVVEPDPVAEPDPEPNTAAEPEAVPNDAPAETSASDVLAETPAAHGPNVVATSVPTGSDQPPLTRRELRRLRTNEMPIVEVDEDQDAPADPGVAINVITEVRTEPDDEKAAADTEVAPSPAADDGDEPTTTVIPALSPVFGAGVGESTWAPDEKATFEDILERRATTSPSSIIMTSSHCLADGIGSTGAARGTTDGRDIDSVLIDGELPPSSSPTPIAASAAISTQKAARDVIRPPAPEKGRSLLLALGITAGGLGILAIGALITLYFTGVFNQ